MSDTSAVSGNTYFNLRTTTKLYQHQKNAIAWTHDKSGGILAADMGTGKTITSLALVAKENLGQILVVAPKSLLAQWKQEIIKHFTVDENNIHIYHGSNRNRPKFRSQFVSALFILTTFQTIRSEYSKVQEEFLALDELQQAEDLNNDNKDSLEVEEFNSKKATIDFGRAELLKIIGEFALIMSQTFGHMIVDEAHVIRNPKTMMFKAMKRIFSIKRWALSGTPGINARKDIITLAEFLGIAPYNKSSWWVDAEQDDLDAWLSEYFYQIKKADVLDLPAKTENTIRLTFGQKQRKHYMLVGDQEYSCLLTKILRLRQATVHNTPGDHPANVKFDEVWRLIVDDFLPKPIETSDPVNNSEIEGEAEAVKAEGEVGAEKAEGEVGAEKADDVVEGETEKADDSIETEKAEAEQSAEIIGTGTLIFSSFKSALIELAKFLEQKKVKYYLFHGGLGQDQRDRIVHSFINSPEPAVMLISIRCGGVGLNLVRASRVILLDPYWNTAMENQAIDRAYRIGQTRPVDVYRLTVKGSIDDWVNKRQITKAKDIDLFMGGKPVDPKGQPKADDRLITEDPIALGPDNRELGTKYF